MDPSSAHSQRHYMPNMHTTDSHGQPFSASSPSSSSAITSPMLAPQSPNTQHTMNLINNLLQMQGLDNTGSAHPQNSPTIPTQTQSSQILLEHQIKLNQLQQLQQLQQQIFQQQIALISGQSPNMLPSGTLTDGIRVHPQMGSMEPGASNSSRDSQTFTGLQTPGPSGEIRPQQGYGANNALANFGEPLPRPLIPASPSNMDNMSQHHRQSSNSSLSIPTLNPHLQRQQQQSMGTFSRANLPLPRMNHPTSPRFHSQRQMHASSRSMSSSNPYPFDHSSEAERNLNLQSSNFGHQIPHYLHPSHSDLSSASSNSPVSAPHSAPEKIAFEIYKDTTGLNVRSPLTPSSYSIHRPDKQRRKIRRADGSNSNSASASPATNEQDMDISPLTSPWLGATPTTTITASNKSFQNQQKSNKRTASMSGDEGNARKKQSPAIGPTLGMAATRNDARLPDNSMGLSISLSRPPEDGGNLRQEPDIHNYQVSYSNGTGADPLRTSNSNTTSPQIVASGTTSSNRGSHRGSKSTNSTPLLRSTVGGNVTTKTRSKSRATATSSAISDTPSPIDLAPDHSSASNLTIASDVDRSMPPPPLPSSVSNKGTSDMNISTTGFNMMDLGNFDMSVNNFPMDFMELNMANMQRGLNHLGDMGMGAENNRQMEYDMNFASFQNMHGEGDVDPHGGMSFGQLQGAVQEHRELEQVEGENPSQQALDQNQSIDGHQDMSDMSSQVFGTQDASRAAQQPMTPSAFLNIRRSGRVAPGGQSALEAVGQQPESTTGPAVAKTRLAQKSASKGSDKEKSTTTARGGRLSKKAVQASPSLKAILPAGNGTPNMDSSMPGTPNLSGIPSMEGGMSAPAVPLPERKNNHKFAEQKRRDSMKNTFDDLRKLLPPIALPTDPNINLDDPSLLLSPLFHPTAPRLPGALPPRGPPKAGGEGPNKSVSKLQLLICGNEYIRLLKGRVERRDEEIQNLRMEIQRLRTRLPISEAEDGDLMELIDLEKDLDAVERHGQASSKEIADASGDGSRMGTSRQTAEDIMDEGDDEGDD